MKSLIAEFEEQSFTQIIFPHAKTDWNCCLKEAEINFINIIKTIIKYQKCLVVCADLKDVKSRFELNNNLYFVEYETDDCWARDISALCVKDTKRVKLLDFNFNGWGSKFEATKDNNMSKNIQNIYSSKPRQACPPWLRVDFVLEGGAIESNGAGVILTTSTCLLNPNRNPNLNSIEITKKLNETLGATEILYLEHGYLAGDDTDSHIDTLARFINETTIMYVAPPEYLSLRSGTCDNEKDEHYIELKLMENELLYIAKKHNFKLIKLPFPHAIYFEDERLPATYANFLFVNGAVLVPTYGVSEDEQALQIFKQTFKDRDIIPIDCSTLIKQHGSLHCVTMNFASGITLLV